MPTADLPSQSLRPGSRAHVVFLALLAATLVEMAWYYPRLPARMASHFDAAGAATAFLPKAAFLRVCLLAVGAIAAMFVVIPALLVRLPARMINLPNKEYWLAPERRERTRATLQGVLVGFGNAVLLFLLLVFHEAMRANLMQVPRLSHRIWVFLIVLVAWTTWWTARFLRAFRRRE